MSLFFLQRSGAQCKSKGAGEEKKGLRDPCGMEKDINPLFCAICCYSLFPPLPLTISAASIVFGDKLTPVNISGLAVTISSIAAYNYMKIRRMRETAKREAHNQMVQEGPVLHAGEAEGRVSGVERSRGHGRSASSTVGMIRNSLSIPVATPAEATKNGERPSPVKRPEDLE